jgi:3-hydroxyisobutyrate dehydrogenase
VSRRVGFVGLGLMGSRMARRLLEAGHQLAVYNRTPAKAEPLVQLGAQLSATPGEVAANSEVVFSCLADDAAVAQVLLGPAGVLAAIQPGSLLIETSTIAPATARQLAAAASAAGVASVDAPLAGTTPQAEQGTLLAFVGGETSAFEASRPLLEVLATRIFHLGPSGAGVTMKLVVNTLLGVGLQALAEALALGQKAGLARDQLLDVLAETAVIAPAHRAKLDFARDHDLPITFPLALMHKDFGLILRQAAELAVPMPATAVAAQLCAAERARNLDEDYFATVHLMQQLAQLPQPDQA